MWLRLAGRCSGGPIGPLCRRLACIAASMLGDRIDGVTYGSDAQPDRGADAR